MIFFSTLIYVKVKSLNPQCLVKKTSDLARCTSKSTKEKYLVTCENENFHWRESKRVHKGNVRGQIVNSE